MKQTNPKPTSPVQETPAGQQLPTQVDVKIHTFRTDGPVLAEATATLNGCFALRGIKLMNGSNGPFVSFPSYLSGGEYKDICFPCTKEFRQQFQETVLSAYQQGLALLPQRMQLNAAPADVPEMTM